MFELTTLGSVELTSPERGSIRTLLAQPKRLMLLVYLLVEAPGGFVRRDKLLALFWPEADEARARASLRQALQFLRRALGEAAVTSRGEDEVGIDPAVVLCDAVAFRADRDDGRAGRAVERYGGDFLDGFLIDDAPGVEAWVSEKRRELQRDAALLAGGLADSAAATDVPGALAHARRALTLAPLDEGAARRVASLLDRSGDRAGALLIVGELRERLQGELGVPPSPETTAFEAQLRGRRLPEALAPEATRDGADQTAAAVVTSQAAAPERDAGDAVRRPRLSKVIGASSIALALVIASLFALMPRPVAPPVTLPALPRVVVAPFVNQTGDSALAPIGGMVADWITEGLSRVEGLTVVPLTAIAAAMRAAGDTRADTSFASMASAAREVGATVLVRGATYRTGGTLHFQVQVTDVGSGALLRPVETVSVPIDSVMAGIDRLRTRVVGGIAPLGDTVSHIRRAVAPPTYEAYRDYVSGLERFVRGDPAGALLLFQRSSVADTAYPMPRIAAAIMYMNLGQADSAARLAGELARVRERLGPLERATLDMVRGLLAADLEAVDRSAREQARVAPGTIGEYMVGEVSRRRARPRAAIAALRALGPDRGELRGWRPYWRELTGSLHMIGDHEEELTAARDGSFRYPNDPALISYEVRALAALGRTAELDSVIAVRATLVREAGYDEGSLLFTASNVLNARGDAAAAQSFRERELAWYERWRNGVRPGELRWRHARALALSGRPGEARDSLLALRAAAPGAISVLGLLGIIATQLSDDAVVAQVLGELQAADLARSAATRSLADGDVAYWRAAMAAQGGDAAAAVAILRGAYASGRSREPTLGSDPWLAPIRDHTGFRRLFSYDN